MEDWTEYTLTGDQCEDAALAVVCYAAKSEKFEKLAGELGKADLMESQGQFRLTLDDEPDDDGEPAAETLLAKLDEAVDVCDRQGRGGATLVRLTESQRVVIARGCELAVERLKALRSPLRGVRWNVKRKGRSDLVQQATDQMARIRTGLMPLVADPEPAVAGTGK